MMLTHFRTHSLKYLSFFVVAILATIISLKIFGVQADTTPSFVRDVVYQLSDYHYAPIKSPHSVAFDASGNMYISDPGIHRIVKFNSSGDYVTTIGSSGTGNGQFNNPNGIAFDASGNMYVVDNSNHRVQKFNSSGVYVSQFGSSGTGNGQFTSPAAIAISTSSGAIYIADTSNSRVQKFDSSGNYVTKWGSFGTGNGQFKYPNGIALDASENVYVTDTVNHRVQKFTSSGVYVSQFGSSGTGNGQFSEPKGIAFDASGNIFVVDGSNRRVQKFNSSGVYVSQFGSSGTGNGQFNYPIGIAFDASGNIFVASYNTTSNVQKFDSSGNYVTKWASGDVVVDGTFHAYKVVVSPAGVIYALDDNNGKILIFDANGDFVSMFGGYDGDHPFSWPSNLGLDASGNVYVLDCGNGIKKYTSAGVYISTFGTGYTFDCAGSIAFDSQGNAYVGDDLHYIEKFDSAGNHLSHFGGSGTGNGQFGSWIGSIYIDADDILYVADSNNRRIQTFDTSGNFLMTFGSAGTGNGQFSRNDQPLAVDPYGYIYVGDLASRVQKFDSNGTYVSEITSANGINFNNTSGLGIDALGNLYVSDIDSGRISVFTAFVPPVTAVISDVVASSSSSGATITWTTDVVGSSFVQFGPTTDYGSTTVEIDTSPRVTSHSVVLSGLISCSVFNYRVKSESATSIITTSSNSTFTTEGCTGLASSTASQAETASTVSTSTLTLSTVTLSIPPDFATTTTATTTFQVVKLEPTAFFASSSYPTGTRSASSDIFHLTALTSSTTTLSTFTAPITVTIQYDLDDLAGIDQSTLTIYRYDGSAWHALSSCTRDPSARTVTCTTQNFSDFALFGTSDSSTQTLGGSGFVTGGGGLTTTIPTSTSSTSTSPVPILVTPVKVQPKTTSTVTKPVIRSTSTSPRVLRATSTPAPSLRRPSLPPQEILVVPNPLPVVTPIHKTFLERLIEVVRGWWR